MSTSDQNNVEGSAARLTERVPADENSIGQAGSLPDVAVLARMANEFALQTVWQTFIKQDTHD